MMRITTNQTLQNNSEAKGMKIEIIQNKVEEKKECKKHTKIKSTDNLGSISSNLKMGNWGCVGGFVG